MVHENPALALSLGQAIDGNPEIKYRTITAAFDSMARQDAEKAVNFVAEMPESADKDMVVIGISQALAREDLSQGDRRNGRHPGC